MNNRLNSTPVKPSIPPLESGDRLSRTEFERRYEAMSEHTKAELIEGIVYIASPVRFERHAEPHGQLIGWMGMYQKGWGSEVARKPRNPVSEIWC